MGRRVAQTILTLVGKADYYRGPFIGTVAKIDDTTIDLHLRHHGGHDFTPPHSITGFETFHDLTPLAINTISRLDETTIRIELQEPAPGPLRLTYLHGARPDTSGAVRDDSELQLPLEPFEAVVE